MTTFNRVMRNCLAAMMVLGLAGCATNATMASAGGAAGDPIGPDKVVYHFNAGLDQAAEGLRYLRNHLEVNPKARIVVVAHARGVDYLMNDKKDANGNPYEVAVQSLYSQGVRFEICLITLRDRNLNKNQFIEEATYVPSGVAEIARLQQREGYAYLRP